jgi:large subunit ribosomal protein L29
MKAKDLRERSAEDLKELEKALTAELFQSRMKNFTNRLDNTSSLGKQRKVIARVKTTLQQKALGIEPVMAAGKVDGKKPSKKASKK